MYFGSSAGVKMFQDEGIDTTFLPFFSQNGEQWIMTTPYFQVALNRDLEQDTVRREKAMKVLNVMLSEQAQNRVISDGQDLLSYSQNVPLRLTEYLKDVRSVVDENHMYIRIASNDFFAVSKDVVSKMIAGKLTAEQAYQAFNAQLLADEEPADNETVLTSGKGYSNVFHANGGNATFSVMANTLRGVYGTDRFKPGSIPHAAERLGGDLHIDPGGNTVIVQIDIRRVGVASHNELCKTAVFCFLSSAGSQTAYGSSCRHQRASVQECTA